MQNRGEVLFLKYCLDIGVSGDFLTEVKPQSDGSNSVRYNLTPEMVKIIFRTYPAVKTKYLEVCPAEMSEKDFWTKFFQSQYFHRDRISASKVSYRPETLLDFKKHFRNRIVRCFCPAMIWKRNRRPNLKRIKL